MSKSKNFHCVSIDSISGYELAAKICVAPVYFVAFCFECRDGNGGHCLVSSGLHCVRKELKPFVWTINLLGAQGIQTEEEEPGSRDSQETFLILTSRGGRQIKTGC